MMNCPRGHGLQFSPNDIVPGAQAAYDTVNVDSEISPLRLESKKVGH